ncbi:hypothetical protein HGRIS_011367 [Hohenbuehelia grisea]|uniref:Ricin B lectin domain-containing protein n=1 Tax=Hohenbuehelia grisea TaxID=104357 RepID=A0ABR3JV26_9AGAR
MRSFCAGPTFALILTASAVMATRNFTVLNNCPRDLTLYINGQRTSSIPPLQPTPPFVMNNTWSGFFYTDLNQGNKDGAATVRAGFWGDGNSSYVVTDPNWFNVGVKIAPLGPDGSAITPHDGFCSTINCEFGNCPQSFTQPPTHLSLPPSGAAPQPPLFQCNEAAAYLITFCPSFTIPNDVTDGRTISPQGQPKKCLDVRGGTFANGTPVQIYDCNGSAAQKWIITRGIQQIKAWGTNFCLDSTTASPASGTKLKIWQCWDNLPAQQWTYTPDNFILLNNADQCVDLTDGKLTNGNQVQTWKCAWGSKQNQLWTISN